MPQTGASTNMTTRRVLPATILMKDKVVNPQGEELGKIDDVMIDFETGRIAYAILSSGGVLGVGDKMYAIPWGLLGLDSDGRRFVLNVDKEVLKTAPGFDKNAKWPDMSEREWGSALHRYYNTPCYW